MQTRRVPKAIAIAGVVLAWLGGGFSGTPTAWGQTAPMVPIATRVISGAGTQPSDYRVQIGANSYVAPAMPTGAASGQPALGGFQVVVVDRATLALLANLSIGTNYGTCPKCPEDAALNLFAMHLYLNDRTASEFVILSSLLDLGESPLGVIAPDVAALGGQEISLNTPVSGGLAYSLIGIPGLGPAAGVELSNYTHPGSTANITGWLAPDSEGNYAFLSLAFGQIVTRTVDRAGAPAITVGSTTHTAPDLPAGAIGGFQVVTLAQDTLALASNQTFGTNFGPGGDNQAVAGQTAMA